MAMREWILKELPADQGSGKTDEKVQSDGGTKAETKPKKKKPKKKN